MLSFYFCGTSKTQRKPNENSIMHLKKEPCQLFLVEFDVLGFINESTDFLLYSSGIVLYYACCNEKVQEFFLYL